MGVWRGIEVASWRGGGAIACALVSEYQTGGIGSAKQRNASSKYRSYGWQRKQRAARRSFLALSYIRQPITTSAYARQQLSIVTARGMQRSNRLT